MSVSRAAAFCLMVAAAVCDARTRRLPNALAFALAAACAGAALVEVGLKGLAANAVMALAVCAALAGFELCWRHAHGGAAGMGMGDIKYLFGAMLLDPAAGLASFAGGLLLLAATGAVTRHSALPVLPFAVVAWALMALVAQASLGV